MRLLDWVQRLGVPLVAVTGNGASTLARHADVVLDCGVSQEACALNLVPTASTTAALALGDALALAVMEKRGFGADELARLHPGGPLGRRLLKVSDLMRTGDAVPRVFSDTPMKDVIYEMSRKGLGITSVVDRSERVVGVVSDGDLRRRLERDDRLLARTAAECMTLEPKTIEAGELATRALHLMEEKRITSLLICDGARRVVGIVHLHDLWRTGMV